MKIYFACPTGQRRDMIVEKYGDTFGACLTRDIFNDITANKIALKIMFRSTARPLKCIIISTPNAIKITA